jgi:hypothetical protein
MNVVNRLFTALDLRRSAALPCFDHAQQLLIGSDYGGQHANSRYESLAFVVADAGALHPWFRARATLREQYLSDGRRMSFKSLNDWLRMEVLPEFLAAADLIPGLLLVVLFDKRIGTIFAPDEAHDADAPLRQQLSQWPARTQEKLLRICHVVALVVAGLTREFQNILWVTDQDDIAANVERHTLFVKIFGNISSHYLQHMLGHLRIATTASDTGSRDIEDFVSIADLAAGAVCHVLNAYGDAGISEVPGLVVPPPANMPQKTSWLLNWFSNDSTPLRRLVLSFDIIENSSRLRVRQIAFPGSSELIRHIGRSRHRT